LKRNKVHKEEGGVSENFSITLSYTPRPRGRQNRRKRKERRWRRSRVEPLLCRTSKKSGQNFEGNFNGNGSSLPGVTVVEKKSREGGWIKREESLFWYPK